MTPAKIAALVRDLAIFGALAFIVWRVYVDGQNAAKVKDLQAIQTQIKANTQTESKWAEEARNADLQHKIDMDTLAARIAEQRTPIIVRSGPACPRPLPANPRPAESATAGAGGGEPTAGSDIDVRPRINDYELWVEAKFAECRAAIASWPK